MMRNAVLPVLLFLGATAASAADPSGQVAVFGTMSEAEISSGPSSVSDDGNGFGIKGWFAPVGGFFLHAEYQVTALDNADLESLRAGGGYYYALTKELGLYGYGEYIDFGSDFDENGFGVHGGAHYQIMPQLGIDGTLGYLMLDDTDGLEASVEAQFNFTKMLGVFAGFRTYMGSGDGFDLDVTDIRAGGVLTFGNM